MRGETIYKVNSRTMPIGIMQGADVKINKFATQKGDVIIMMSDGCCPDSDDCPWLVEFLCGLSKKNRKAHQKSEPYGVEHKFTDIETYWGATFVDFLYNAGITTGYADGTFRPDQKITRAQFAVMLYRYLGLNEADYEHVVLPFADNAKIGDYAVPAIKALYTEGIINGSTGKDGRLYFNPNSSLTRAQAATMIGRTQEKGYDSVELTFADAAKIPAYATAYIQTMAAQGVISGYTDGTFKPNNPITRGQMAKILYNLM
jgi:hypothetical protein